MDIEERYAKKWLILTIIVLIYLPVTIDATVMHVATPSLSAALNLTANQLLWVIALYTTNFTEPLSYQDSAFLKLPKFP